MDIYRKFSRSSNCRYLHQTLREEHTSRCMLPDMATFSSNCFVALPPSTKDGVILFAKNSGRPVGEVQEVVYIEGDSHSPGTKLECTYIEIDQAAATNAVFLSKPAWMWGAEMGSNEHGVCIGLAGVNTKLQEEGDKEEKLLGHDLLRLGLERASNAKGAVEVISTLLEKHGQGGNWQESTEFLGFHSSFLIIDRTEAWVLETAGSIWAAKKLEGGIYGITSSLTLDTTFDAVSDNLQDVAKSRSLWKEGDGEINFSKVFGVEGDTTGLTSGMKALEEKNGSVDLQSMFELLRSPSLATHSICGSMVSLLSPSGSKLPCFHFASGTPDPGMSVFKPFVFTTDANFPSCTVSPKFGKDDPAKGTPRFQRPVDRRHSLYKHHQEAYKSLKEEDSGLMATMLGMEAEVLTGVEGVYSGSTEFTEGDLRGFFNDCVETEIKFYL